MRNITLSLWGLLLVLTGLWLLADTMLPQPLTFISVRHVMVQYSGIIGISVMSVAMILATRPRWLESYLGGLDKTYRLHKWLGITGLVVAVTHWLWVNAPKWLVSLGWMDRPRRGGAHNTETLGTIEQFFHAQRELAESIGEWAFYAVVLFIALALIKRFPYRLFARTHKWIAVVYLLLVCHAVVLLKFSYWTQPIGLVTGLLMVAGVVSATLVLFNRVGIRNQVQGTVESLQYFPEIQVLETSIRLDQGWRGHQGGQFAFVSYDPKEGSHPYTIGSAWDPHDRRIVFITKALGDYTAVLPDSLKTGDRVKVEGPYGRFTFDDQHKRQIWIGGGIGITPFIARMKQLAQTPGKQTIDLFHTIPKFEQAPIDKLTTDAAAANVRLHVLVDDKDGLLDGARIRSTVPEWQSASIWFCGPIGFGKAIRQDLIANGLPPREFHQELFAMR